MAYWLYPVGRYYYHYDEPPQAPTDADIKAMVVDQLRASRYTKDEDLTVDVKQGVVVLGGTVRTALTKRAAGDDVWDTPEVVDVSNQLVVSAA